MLIKNSTQHKNISGALRSISGTMPLDIVIAS